MRLKNSFAAAVAAAVAAIVFSAAMQPVEATPILIDDFTSQTGTATQTTTNVVLSPQLSRSGSFGGFTSGNGSAVDIQIPGGSRTGTVTVSGGVGTLSVSNDGTGSGATNATGSGGYWIYSAGGGAVNLTAGDNDTLRIVSGATVPAGTIYKQYVTVFDGTVTGTSFVNSWTANTTYDFPFSSFTGVNFGTVQQITVGMRNPADIPASTPYSATLSLDSIAAVPEPSQMAMLVGAGVILSACRLRKLRRARPAAGEAITG